jgi:arthrofactin-type cyclic lipopeptide synthetase C
VYEPPQGEIETAVAAIWAEVLKTERVGRHDNFFALGGHSLLTLQVVSLLNQLDIDIVATDLFTEPTLASLANKIRLEGKVVLKDRAIPVRASGNQSPLFLTHEGGGDLLYLPALAPYLDSEIPIYGLPSRPADEVPLRTMEGMAARMVQMIRAAQPMGPYRVGGWSFGGLLAYEIAAQLIAEDQEVEFLGLFDRPIPGLSVASPGEPDRQLAPDQQPPRAATEGLTRTQLEQRQARNQFFTAAQEAYKARTLPIPIHLFRAQENGIPDPLLGWGSVVPEGLLRVIEVPGTHFSMMSKPNIEKLGKVLSDAMRKAKNESRRNREQGQSPLVLLQSGGSNEPPLFCIPGAGASVSSFLELTSALRQGRPVYGIEPRGLDGVLLPHSTVQAAAEAYLQAILGTHIEAPIHLLGHSFGGWKALELAVRLQKAGHSVASLTLLDTDPPDNDLTIVREYNAIQAILEWAQVFEQVLGRPLGVCQADLESHNEAEQRKVLHRLLVNEGLLPHRSDPESLRGQLQTFAAALRTHYKPSEVYEGRVQLILATDPKLDQVANREKREEFTSQWKAWAPNLVCIQSRANHMTLLRPPHVHEVARLIPDPVVSFNQKQRKQA